MQHAPIFFQNWYNVERTITLSIVGYAALFTMLRISGKRMLSKLNVFDFVFVVAVGSVFASMIISKDVTLVEGVAAMATLMLIQLLLAELAARFPKLERVINGEPTLLLSNGKFIRDALKKERVTEEEVRGAIRGEGVTRTGRGSTRPGGLGPDLPPSCHPRSWAACPRSASPSTIAGLVTIARATEARCCSPPDISAGR